MKYIGNIYTVEGIPMQKPKSQKDLIHNTNWDILLLLDACRFKEFKQYIHCFIKGGVLIPTKSEGTATGQWLMKTWTNIYPDIIYISGNAYINSKNVKVCNFNGKKHFAKIIDVWDYGFDKNTGRVEPEKINQAAYKEIDDDDTYRYVLHYQQPHAPYLFIGTDSTGGFYKHRHPFIRKMIPIKLQWLIVSLHPRIRKIFIKKNKYKKMYERHGNERVRKAYETNLLHVLYEVRKIVDKYPNKNILITADHGERLGEDGKYGHGGKPNDILTTVPFYYIDRRKNDTN